MNEKQRIARLIKNLPRNHQLILSMVYVEDLSLDEISTMCGFTPAETYSLYLQALKSLYDF